MPLPALRSASTLLLHALVWGLVAVLLVAQQPEFPGPKPPEFWLTQAVVFGLLAAVFYFNVLWAAPRLLYGRRVPIYLALNAVAILGVLAAHQQVEARLHVPDPLPTDPRLAPMLFQPFVENAFKHGVSATAPSCITIELGQPGPHEVRLCVRNTVFDRPAEAADDEPGGIGLANTRRRLALLYPGRHQLAVAARTAQHEYEVCLSLLL